MAEEIRLIAVVSPHPEHPASLKYAFVGGGFDAAWEAGITEEEAELIGVALPAQLLDNDQRRLRATAKAKLLAPFSQGQSG